MRDSVEPRGKVSEKGQVTLPLEMRDALGIEGGMTVAFELREAEGGILVRKGSQRENRPVDQVRGILKLAKTVDEVIDEMRGPRSAGPRRHR